MGEILRVPAPGAAGPAARRGGGTRETAVIRLSIDFENPARHWWEAGGQDLWDGISEGFDGSAVVVERSLAESWLEAARKIPGWDDGPEYAPHPVAAAEVDEFEPDF
jgi:hypothetical protein